MRVLAISNNMPHEDDPVCGIFAARQFLEMQRQGAEVTVLCVNAFLPRMISRNPRYRYFRRRRLLPLTGIRQVMVHYVRPPGKYALLLDAMIASQCAQRRIASVHREVPFSVIYGRGLWLPSEVGLRIGRPLGLPVVGVGTGSDVNVCPDYGRLFHRRFAWIARSLDGTLATGKSVAKRIEAVTGRQCKVIGGLVDLNVFVPIKDKRVVRQCLGLPRDAVILLFVGHVIESKGVFELLQAFRALAAGDSRMLLAVCGDGEHWHRLKEQLNEAGLAERVLLPGSIAPAAMPRWMQASDVFVLPSHREGMPNAVMEAMACGLPVITTRVGGLPDALSDTEGAILVEPHDAKGLAQAMGKLLSDHGLRQRMAAAAREKAERSFGITPNVAVLLQCLHEAAKRGTT
jgi:teichuronic acid biosynthesis glycosyltransferase TuaC